MEWLQVDQDVLNTMQKNEEEGNRKGLMVSPGPGAHPASCTMGTGHFPGVEATGVWC